MDKKKDLNTGFIAELDKIFADLFKEIGNNRQQLTAKVFTLQGEFRKELSKNKIDEKREKEIRQEVTRTVKMAHSQLPHLSAPKPAIAATPKAEKAPSTTKTPAAKPKPAAKKKK